MRNRALGVVLVAACSHDGASVTPVCHDAALQVGVTHGTIKVRDDSPVPAAQTIALDAAKNEFEPFQIVVNGGAGGVTDLHVTTTMANVRMYQEGRYFVRYASSAEGGSGYWPDPLIPDVDAYAHEPRNAFVHFDLAPNQTRAVWVDVFVPPDATPGMQTGTFTVSGTGLAPTTITVQLRVRNFTLPSTSSLPTAFNLSVDSVTRAHLGGQWCSDHPAAQTDALLMAYARAALDHRISLMSSTCGNPTSDLGGFDQVQGTLYDGTAATQLAGARVRSFRNPSESGMTTLAQHFAQKQWTGLVDYSCDEPPMACDEASWPARAQAAHDAGIPNLVTTTYSYLQQKGWTNLVDIVAPVAETMSEPTRASYAPFLALGPQKQLWWYQSCDSHGCGGCDAGMASFDQYRGLPSYVIDSDARQNRSMEWLSFIFGMQGELYYETAQNLPAGLDWDSGYAYCAFGGNGDGSLFYPGKPADPRIGGTTDFPLESIRMKLIREGMEDYEYLALYAQKFGRDAAVAKAKEVFPDVFGGKAHPAELLYEVRKQLADAIEGAPTPDAVDVPHIASVDLQGDLHELAAAPAIAVGAGAATAMFHVAWTDDALVLAADVADADVRPGAVDALYAGDAIEVMLDPRHTATVTATPDDLQVIVSAAGDKYDARGAGATGDGSYDIPGLAWHAAPTATGYRIAVAIPWSALALTPADGTLLGGDLALDNLDATGLVYADWAAITPFAQPSRWHTLRLVSSPENCP